WALGSGKSGPSARHYDGTTWGPVSMTGIPASETRFQLGWASASGEVWAIGEEGTYRRAAAAAAGTTMPVSALAVHGSAPDNVWLIDRSTGQLTRWDGAAFTAISAPLPHCSAAHGLSANEVWVGCDTSLEHWDGAGWTAIDVPDMADGERVTGVFTAAV